MRVVIGVVITYAAWYLVHIDLSLKDPPLREIQSQTDKHDLGLYRNFPSIGDHSLLANFFTAY